jgi:hypothetical protein
MRERLVHQPTVFISEKVVGTGVFSPMREQLVHQPTVFISEKVVGTGVFSPMGERLRLVQVREKLALGTHLVLESTHK